MKSIFYVLLVTCLFVAQCVFAKDTPLDFGSASGYAILAGSTITSTGAVGTVITGNMGVFPGTAVTGFPPAVLNGAIDSGNTAAGNAQGSLTVAYNTAAAKQFDTSLSNTDLGGMTLLPGVYNFDGVGSLNGMLTLDANNDPDAVWTFQIASELYVALGSSMIFKDSIGNPDHVYWQVGTSAVLNTGCSLFGNIMAHQSISAKTDATVSGRLLALNAAVTLDKNVVTIPPAAQPASCSDLPACAEINRCSTLQYFPAFYEYICINMPRVKN